MRTWNMTMTSDEAPATTRRLTDDELSAALWNLLHGSGTFDVNASRAANDTSPRD